MTKLIEYNTLGKEKEINQYVICDCHGEVIGVSFNERNANIIVDEISGNISDNPYIEYCEFPYVHTDDLSGEVLGYYEKQYYVNMLAHYSENTSIWLRVV